MQLDRNSLKIPMSSKKGETSPVRCCFDVCCQVHCHSAIRGHPYLFQISGKCDQATSTGNCFAMPQWLQVGGCSRENGIHKGIERILLSLLGWIKLDPWNAKRSDFSSEGCRRVVFWILLSKPKPRYLEFILQNLDGPSNFRGLKDVQDPFCESNFQLNTPERFGWRLSTTSLRQYTSQNFACGYIPMASLYCGRSTCTLWNRDELLVHLEAIREICC